MKFYPVEQTLADRIAECTTRVRVQIAFDFSGTAEYIPIPETHILELTVTSLRETTGGTVTKAELILDNTTGAWSPRDFDTYRPEYNKYNGIQQSDGMGNLRPGREARISYTCGTNIPFVKRFTLYVDDTGFQHIATGYRTRACKVVLVDLADTLKNTDKTKDWTENVILVHSKICDKEHPGASIVHQIAARAGLTAQDIDCSTVLEYLPYIKLTRSAWGELSDLATIYDAHLETATEKPLVFVNTEDEIQYTFDQTNTTHIRMYDLLDQYRNTVRMRWTRYREYLARELWRYSDPPVIYGANLSPTYPFVADGEKRAIEKPGYEARYTVANQNGKPLTVVYAETIDSVSAFATNLQTSGSALEVLGYDITTARDRANIRLGVTADTVLKAATIHGDAIAGEPNFSHYISDELSIAIHGTKAANVSTPYLSETLRDGVPFYAWRAERMLAKLKRFRKGFFLKTNRGVFNARVGAPVKVSLADGLASERAEIVRMELRYKAREAFVASFYLEED